MCFEKIPVINSYSRAQAIADGVLVDVSNTPEWKEAGFKYPTACTRAVWERFIEWTEADTDRQTIQDQPGRLWDVLYMLNVAIAENDSTDRLLFELFIVPRGGTAKQSRRTMLKALCGPGDDGEPVITIMLPSED
jgi:hypothetical protein